MEVFLFICEKNIKKVINKLSNCKKKLILILKIQGGNLFFKLKKKVIFDNTQSIYLNFV